MAVPRRLTPPHKGWPVHSAQPLSRRVKVLAAPAAGSVSFENLSGLLAPSGFGRRPGDLLALAGAQGLGPGFSATLTKQLRGLVLAVVHAGRALPGFAYFGHGPLTVNSATRIWVMLSGKY
jgi:hypothetical protein